MRDYRQNPPTAEDIYTHLLFTVHWRLQKSCLITYILSYLHLRMEGQALPRGI